MKEFDKKVLKGSDMSEDIRQLKIALDNENVKIEDGIAYKVHEYDNRDVLKSVKATRDANEVDNRTLKRPDTGLKRYARFHKKDVLLMWKAYQTECIKQGRTANQTEFSKLVLDAAYMNYATKERYAMV